MCCYHQLLGGDKSTINNMVNINIGNIEIIQKEIYLQAYFIMKNAAREPFHILRNVETNFISA